MLKRLFSIFSCLVLAMTVLFMTSCDKRSRFEKKVKEQSKQLPIEISEGLTFEKMGYDKESNILSFTYAMNSEEGQFILSNISTDYLRNRMASILSTQTSDAFMKDILDVGASLRFVYYIKDTNKSMEITLSHDEIKSIVNRKKKGAFTPAEILNNEITEANRAAPMHVYDDLYLTKISDEGRYVVMEYTFYESDIDLDVLKNNHEEIKADMNLKEENTLSFDLDILKQLNKGLILRYKNGNTLQSGDIVFETYEL